MLQMHFSSGLFYLLPKLIAFTELSNPSDRQDKSSVAGLPLFENCTIRPEELLDLEDQVTVVLPTFVKDNSTNPKQIH